MRLLRDDSGLSLTELLLVSVLVLVVMAAAWALFGAATNMNNIAMARAQASDEAANAFDIMTRELRQAQDVPGTTTQGGALLTAGPTDIKFYCDLTGDKVPELVRYYVDGTSLKRTVAAPTKTTTPYTYAAPGTPTILVKKLASPTATIFCYHRGGSGTGVIDNSVMCSGVKHGFTVVTTADPYNTNPKIAMVGITLDAVGTSGNKSVTVISRALVRLRTVDNTVK